MKKLTQEGERCGDCGKVKTYDVYEHFCDECGKTLEYNSQTGYYNPKIFYNWRKTETPEFCDIFCYYKWLMEHIDEIKEKGLKFLMPPTLTPEDVDDYLDCVWGVGKKADQ